MNRADAIRSMTDEQLAQFLKLQERLGLLDISFRCWFYCSEYGCGCFHKCAHNQGDEFRKRWLQEECGDFSAMAETVRNASQFKTMRDLIGDSDQTAAETTSAEAATSFASQFFKKGGH